jgi:hypothetical protein
MVGMVPVRDYERTHGGSGRERGAAELARPMPSRALRQQLRAHGLMRERKLFDINREVHGRSAIHAASQFGEGDVNAAGEIEPTARPLTAPLFEREANFLMANSENISISFWSFLLYTGQRRAVDRGCTPV